MVSREHAIDELVKLGVSNYSGAGIRVGNAKRIFDTHSECEAIDIILDSRRVSVTVLNAARTLKNHIC
jgi:hypothetical protein